MAECVDLLDVLVGKTMNKCPRPLVDPYIVGQSWIHVHESPLSVILFKIKKVSYMCRCAFINSNPHTPVRHYFQMGRWQCHICHQEFATSSSGLRHKRTMHGPNKQCTRCTEKAEESYPEVSPKQHPIIAGPRPSPASKDPKAWSNPLRRGRREISTPHHTPRYPRQG